MTGHKFAARYQGRCPASCGEPIEVGDDLIVVDDQAVHLDCAGDRSASQLTTREVCPRCFLERSAVGTCGCES